MQFKSIVTLALFGAATTAAPVVEGVVDRRQISVITGALEPVKQALTALDTAIKGLQPGGNVAAQTADLTSKSKAVEKALNDGTAAVGNAQSVSLTEALQVQSASQALTALTQSTVNDLISKKDVIDKAGQKKVTLDNLNAQKTASDAFIAKVVSKVPSAVSGVAQSLSKSVGEALQKGITAYS